MRACARVFMCVRVLVVYVRASASASASVQDAGSERKKERQGGRESAQDAHAHKGSKTCDRTRPDRNAPVCPRNHESFLCEAMKSRG